VIESVAELVSQFADVASTGMYANTLIHHSAWLETCLECAVIAGFK